MVRILVQFNRDDDISAVNILTHQHVNCFRNHANANEQGGELQHERMKFL